MDPQENTMIDSPYVENENYRNHVSSSNLSIDSILGTSQSQYYGYLFGIGIFIVICILAIIFIYYLTTSKSSFTSDSNRSDRTVNEGLENRISELAHIQSMNMASM
jgi:uncharacterized membrane protein